MAILEFVCRNCGKENSLDPEKEDIYEKAGLIEDGELVKYPFCIQEKIEVVNYYFTPRVIGTGPYGSGTYLAPHYQGRVVVIEPQKR